MGAVIEPFGHTRSGKAIERYTLNSSTGMACNVISYGAALQSLLVPDRLGRLADVVLGFDSLSGYESEANPFMGAIIGRHANRIAGSSFEISGQSYAMAPNEGRNNLHSGPGGFHSAVWSLTDLSGNAEPAIRLTYESPDGESGFPGNLSVTVEYRLTAGNVLEIAYDAVADQDTVINLTNHAYFNLGGHNSGSVLQHVLQLEADAFTPIDGECLPDGRILPVAGTVFDFRTPKAIGRDLRSLDQQIRFGHGYDHNFIIRPGAAQPLRQCASISEPASGRQMIVETTSPGVQLYTGNHLNLEQGKAGANYRAHSGFCLETQYYPDALRHSHFPSPIFRKGQHFLHQTSFRFGIESL